MSSIAISASGISVAVDLQVGHISDLRINVGERVLCPLHRAPWIGEANLPTGIAPGLERLSGDFLCAPFSYNDVEPGPGHGWPANSPWTVIESAAIAGGWRATLRLVRPVMGASIEKSLILRDGHPFLYQEHRIIGGVGELPVAHHVMSAMTHGGKLAFSPKRFAETPSDSLEPDPARGRYRLSYPARSQDIHRFPTQDGGTIDLSEYAADERREDFVTLVEELENKLGWTALQRTRERDLILVLKAPRELPITMLWYSNGGRDYPPWNGRHIGVLGIEDGRTAVGHRQSIGKNSLRSANVPTSFTLLPDGVVTFRHVIGGLPADTMPEIIEPQQGTLLLRSGESELRVPFDTEFLMR